MIPSRIAYTPPSEEQRQFATSLCDQIESSTDKQQRQVLIDEWNQKVVAGSTPYEWVLFETYYGSQDQEEFVDSALMPDPVYDHALCYSEAISLLRFICECQGSLVEQDYYLSYLEINFPHSGVYDLIYWPNEWFADKSLFHVNLTPEAMLYCLAIANNRFLRGQPESEKLSVNITDALENKISSCQQ